MRRRKIASKSTLLALCHLNELGRPEIRGPHRNCLNEDVGAVGVVESSPSCNSGDLQVAARAAECADS